MPSPTASRTLYRRVRGGVGRRVRQLPRVLARARHGVPGGQVALTFDDGPHPDFTPAVLDVLEAHGTRATFFLVGRNAAAHPQLVRRIHSAGHVVGSHSQTHPDPWTLGIGAVAAEYLAGRRSVEASLGHTTALFRPPKGHLDWAGLAAIRRARLQTWLWSVDPRDWEPGVTADQLVERLTATRPGDVVLLHDGIEQPLAAEALDRSATVAALERFLAASAGLDFGTLAA